MSREKRKLRKKFIVFCEGDTEYNYIDTMRLNQGVELALKPINMHGGGYSNFLEVIKKEANNNCFAKFKLQNSNKRIPHFLILDNPDFEYIACLHILEYQGQDVKKFIEQTLGFKNIDNFKAKKDVYEYLNTKGNSYNIMLDRLKEYIVKNSYNINKSNFDIRITKTDVIWDNENKRGSNIREMFEIIDW